MVTTVQRDLLIKRLQKGEAMSVEILASLIPGITNELDILLRYKHKNVPPLLAQRYADEYLDRYNAVMRNINIRLLLFPIVSLANLRIVFRPTTFKPW